MDAKTYAIFKKLSSGNIPQNQIDEIAGAVGIATPSNVVAISNKLDEIITTSNNTTGETDTTLTDAVQSLIDGFGGGGQAFEYDIIEYTVTTDSSSGGSGTLYTIPHGLDYTPSWFVAMQVPGKEIINGRMIGWWNIGNSGMAIGNSSSSSMSLWNGTNQIEDTPRAYADSDNFYIRSREWNGNSVTSGSTIYVITKNMGV